MFVSVKKKKKTEKRRAKNTEYFDLCVPHTAGSYLRHAPPKQQLPDASVKGIEWISVRASIYIYRYVYLCLSFTRKGLELLLEQFGWISRFVYTHCAAHLRGVAATRIISGCATFLGLHFKVKTQLDENPTPTWREQLHGASSVEKSPRLASNWFIYLMFLFVCFGFWLILWRLPSPLTLALRQPSRLVSCNCSLPYSINNWRGGLPSVWCHVQMLYNKWNALRHWEMRLWHISQEVGRPRNNNCNCNCSVGPKVFPANAKQVKTPTRRQSRSGSRHLAAQFILLPFGKSPASYMSMATTRLMRADDTKRKYERTWNAQRSVW